MARSRSAWATPAPLRLPTGMLSRLPPELDHSRQSHESVVSCRTASKQQSAAALVSLAELPRYDLMYQALWAARQSAA